MTKSVPYTKIRNNIYQYNRRVPKEIWEDLSARKRFFREGEYLHIFQNKEYCRGSLKTKCHHEALQIIASVNEEFARRQSIAIGGVKSMAITPSMIHRNKLDQNFLDLLFKETHDSKTESFRRMGLKADAGDDTALDQFVERLEYSEQYADKIQEELTNPDDEQIELEIGHFTKKYSLDVPKGTLGYGRMKSVIRNAYLESCETEMQLQNLRFEHYPSTPTYLNATTIAEEFSGETIDQLRDRFYQTTKPADTWKEKIDTAVALLTEYVGDQQPISKFTKSMAQDFKETLKRTPSNRNKAFPGKSLSEAIELNEQRNSPRDCLKPSTINGGYIAPLSKLFSFALEREEISSNPFLKIKVKDPTKKRSVKTAFSNENLSALFSLPYLKGHKSHGSPHSAGNAKFNDHRYWAPLIALYTGARVSEIGGLELRDVNLEAKFPHITIRENSMRGIKSANANRIIPLPKEFIEIGFKGYIETVNLNKYRRLFPFWEPKTKLVSGAAMERLSSANWLRQFTRLIRKEILDLANGEGQSSLGFHSFRKNYRQKLGALNIPQQAIEELMGHEKTQMDEIYGSRMNIEQLGPFVKGLSYRDALPDYLFK